jgi:hypothetical protein
VRGTRGQIFRCKTTSGCLDSGSDRSDYQFVKEHETIGTLGSEIGQPFTVEPHTQGHMTQRSGWMLTPRTP